MTPIKELNEKRMGALPTPSESVTAEHLSEVWANLLRESKLDLMETLKVYKPSLAKELSFHLKQKEKFG